MIQFNFHVEKMYRPALEAVVGRVLNNTPFTYDEIYNETIEKGGVLAVSFGVPVGRYILNLENQGYLTFNKETEKFEPAQVH